MGKHKTQKTPSRKRALTSAELRLLRNLIPDPVAQAAYRQMAEEGLIELPTKPVDRQASLRYKPVRIKGKPLSETVIEERR